MWDWLFNRKREQDEEPESETPPPKHFYFRRVPKRVSSWKLSRDDLGLDEVPIHERLIWRNERGR
jgi:hypothetical protein